MSKKAILLSLVTLTAFADPRPQMNQALQALSNLLPYLGKEERFLDKENEKQITEDLTRLQTTFGSLKHDQLLKNDLFAPSYQLIKENIAESLKAFKEGNKDFAHWRLGEITQQCLDCHTRLPESYTSRFQERRLSLDPKKFDSLYDLGTAQIIVRDYNAAEKSFLAVIEDNIQSKKFFDTEEAMKGILLIRTKASPDYKKMLSFVEKYKTKKELPMDLQEELSQWEKRLKEVQKVAILNGPLKDDKSVRTLIDTFLVPVKEKDDVFLDNYDVYLLTSNGLLSRYLFNHPQTELAPEISYWLGWEEKVLKRDQFSGSGDLFLKQCIRRHPKSSIAPKCFQELKESVEFEFSGSGGTDVPPAVRKELDGLESLLRKK